MIQKDKTLSNDFEKLVKNYLEKLNNLLEQDEDIEIDSVNELVEKFNNYGKD
jgi:superoxide dismutase